MEVYEYRRVMYSMIRKNLFGKYKNSFFGFLWHFFQPLLLMAIYYIVFTEVRSSAIPDYWIYLSSALFPFNFMTSNLTAGSGAITDDPGMVKKIYFPREILVLSKVLSSFIVMVLGYSVVLALIICLGHATSITFLMVPVVLLLMLLFVTGYVLLLSSITVYVRDLRYFMNSIYLVFIFMTPMYFMANEVSGILETIIWYNPFTYYVEFLHSIIYFQTMPGTSVMLVCTILPIATLLIGYAVFRRLKPGFVERL